MLITSEKLMEYLILYIYALYIYAYMSNIVSKEAEM